MDSKEKGTTHHIFTKETRCDMDGMDGADERIINNMDVRRWDGLDSFFSLVRLACSTLGYIPWDFAMALAKGKSRAVKRKRPSLSFSF